MTGVARGTGLDANGGVPGNIVGVCPFCLVYKKGILLQEGRSPHRNADLSFWSGTCDDVCGVDNCDTQKQEQLQGAEPCFT